MSTPTAPLKLGDRIRIVRLPPEWKTANYHVTRSTREVFRRLIARRRPIRINEIDERGLPWIRCQFIGRTGRKEIHFLVIDDGCWVRVIPRKRRK